jgi:hypothetical protein
LEGAVTIPNEGIKEEKMIGVYSWCAVRDIPESILNNRYTPYLDWLP